MPEITAQYQNLAKRLERAAADTESVGGYCGGWRAIGRLPAVMWRRVKLILDSFQLVSQGGSQPDYAGPIPPEVQLCGVFIWNCPTSSKQSELGGALVQFITSPAAQAFFKSKGFDAL
jgi:hypothetical protein